MLAMRGLRVCICAATVAAWSSVSSADGETDINALVEFVRQSRDTWMQSAEAFVQGYRDEGKNEISAQIGSWSSTEVPRLARELDDAVAKLLTVALSGGRSLQELQRCTEDVIWWQEWPSRAPGAEQRGMRGIGDPGLSKKEWRDPRNGVVVLYRRCSLGPGHDLYVVQNSLWTPIQHSCRLRRITYAIEVEGEHSVRTEFDSEVPTGFSLGLLNIEQFLGFFDCGDIYPWVMFYWGPEGTGQFAALKMYAYDKDQGMWKYSCSCQFDEMGDVRSYDEATGLFTYTCGNESSEYDTAPTENPDGSWTLSVPAWIARWCKCTSPRPIPPFLTNGSTPQAGQTSPASGSPPVATPATDAAPAEK